MIKITLSAQSAQFLDAATPQVRDHIVAVLRSKAALADYQMIVVSWTMDGSYPHIERAIKDYRFKPGIRALFHIVKRESHLHIDRIDWRDCDPYGDGK